LHIVAVSGTADVPSVRDHNARQVRGRWDNPRAGPLDVMVATCQQDQCPNHHTALHVAETPLGRFKFRPLPPRRPAGLTEPGISAAMRKQRAAPTRRCA
jgi:hypothetical protein